MQTPLSRLEPDQYLNDRYAAMEERLGVGPQSDIDFLFLYL